MKEYCSVEAEQMILGSIIINNDYLNRVEFLEVEHFYFNENRLIFKQIIEGICQVRQDKITLEFFFENKLQDVGGVKYLRTLLCCATGAVDIRDYGWLVVDFWQKRQAILINEEFQKNLDEMQFSQAWAIAEDKYIALQVASIRKPSKTLKELIHDKKTKGKSNKFYPTGLSRLDDLLCGGFYSKELTTVAGYSGLGKTTLIQQFMLHFAKNKIKCLFLSLEMSEESVLMKFLSYETGISVKRLRMNILYNGDEEKIDYKEKELAQLPIVINDTGSMSIKEIRAEIAKQVKKNGVDVIFLDYIQIVKYSNNRYNEATLIKEISTGLKEIAKTFDVAVIGLSQLNRDKSKPNDYVPTLNDIKGSHGIVEDSDVVLVMHRDKLENKEDMTFSNQGKIVGRKLRFNEGAACHFKFDGQSGKFIETGGF